MDCEGQFVGARDGFDDDVFALDARGEECFLAAEYEGFDYGGVPAGVDDGYS